MATTVTYTFSNSTTADATQVNQNLTDILTGLNALEVLTNRGDIITRGASAPQRLALGTAGKHLRSDGTDALWAFSPVSSAKSADYTITDSDGVDLVLMTTSSTNRTVTLPAAANNTNRRITVIKVDNGTGTCIVDGNAAETVNGSATYTLYYQYQAITLYCNGSTWYSAAIQRFPTSHINVVTGNGHGSTNTKIRRFTTSTTVGTGLTFADTAAAGSSFTINEAGVYTMHYCDTRSGSTSGFGISLNSSQLTTDINSITTADRLAYVQAGAAIITSCSATRRLAAGDVIRAHDDGSADGATSAIFSITQVAVL